ncbi:hypothetical protein [Pseudomonas sp. GW456-12-1-14-TSB6]|uniref:hypothetical protein n=1 Tax=Pseudomonas sp. GW456-12-1-14-TSB6 TaxID=2751350 RepID=UPI000CD09697|nr:hypothetical protein [Pseudomonas sp. GW456-12-1-14-TSB6]POA30644.1 hypothetical protein C1891_25760 [Pseudomonas sp. GW456-12-1-14-TSB6]
MSDITFPGAINGVITCRSDPMNGIKVKIGPLTGAQIGGVLTITWQGYSDPSGSVPIPGTQTSLNHFITQNDVDNGVEKNIGDWLANIKPIQNGSARVDYTINGGGGNNALVAVRLLNSSGQSCDEV